MSSPYSPARVGADAGVSDGLAPPPLRQRAASSAYTEGACDASSAADAAAAAAGGGAMECSIYQNYSASEVFVQGLAGMVDQQDVEAMIRAQKKMLQRFEKTNEMLSNCNTLSSTRLERARRDFKAHTVMSVTNKTLSFCRNRLLNILLRFHVAFQGAGDEEGSGLGSEADSCCQAENSRPESGCVQRYPFFVQ